MRQNVALPLMFPALKLGRGGVTNLFALAGFCVNFTRHQDTSLDPMKLHNLPPPCRMLKSYGVHMAGGFLLPSK